MIGIGIDTGLTGAVAFLEATGAYIAVHDLPVIRDRKLAWIDASALLAIILEVRAGREMRAVVERTHAMPRNGTVAAFSQGCTLGSVLATMQAAAVSVELVSPVAWKKAAGLSKDKSAALGKARLLYPTAPLDRVKDHNRGEAILIARHGLSRMRAVA